MNKVYMRDKTVLCLDPAPFPKTSQYTRKRPPEPETLPKLSLYTTLCLQNLSLQRIQNRLKGYQ